MTGLRLGEEVRVSGGIGVHPRHRPALADLPAVRELSLHLFRVRADDDAVRHPRSRIASVASVSCGRAATTGALGTLGLPGSTGCARAGAALPPPSRNAVTSSLAAAKFNPLLSRSPQVASPTTLPSPSPTGPPEFPGFIGASVWTCQTSFRAWRRPEPPGRPRTESRSDSPM